MPVYKDEFNGFGVCNRFAAISKITGGNIQGFEVFQNFRNLFLLRPRFSNINGFDIDGENFADGFI